MMLHTDMENFKENMQNILERAITHGDPVTLHTKAGNVVIMSEKDYTSMMQKMTEGMNTPPSNCFPETDAAETAFCEAILSDYAHDPDPEKAYAFTLKECKKEWGL